MTVPHRKNIEIEKNKEIGKNIEKRYENACDFLGSPPIGKNIESLMRTPTKPTTSKSIPYRQNINHKQRL